MKMLIKKKHNKTSPVDFFMADFSFFDEKLIHLFLEFNGLLNIHEHFTELLTPAKLLEEEH